MELTNDGYTLDSVRSLKKSYPVGTRVVVYPAFANEAQRYTPRFYGEVVAVNKMGVQTVVWSPLDGAEGWHESDGRSMQLALKPGIDRFEIVNIDEPNLTSYSEILLGSR